ncbi:MAG: hypothetical protein J2P18_05130 [Nocardia sp.]|nr:hypothetical protein [Nocardia sp.]
MADAIIKAADTMHTAIHDSLNWKGKAGDAAKQKADSEQKQMRAVATGYDQLSKACTSAFNEMNETLAELKSVFKNYVIAPVTVSDDWKVTGIKDPNSEAGIQLARIPGLATALLHSDDRCGREIADANEVISAMASDSALKAETAAITKIKKDDPKALPDGIATNPTSFWKPDIPGMTASAVVGSMTEATRKGMEHAAQDAGDPTMLKWVENWGKSTAEKGITKDLSSGISHFGLLGNAVGTIPSIADDIHDGMDPTKAVVTEAGGAETGMIASGLAEGVLTGGAEGALDGSFIPGAGTAAGFVVGGAAGLVGSYLGSKGLQALWDKG